MVKIYRLNKTQFYINNSNMFYTIFEDICTVSYLLGLSYLNYTYLGNSWYIGIFIVISLFGFIMRIFSKDITKGELLKELNKK